MAFSARHDGNNSSGKIYYPPGHKILPRPGDTVGGQGEHMFPGFLNQRFGGLGMKQSVSFGHVRNSTSGAAGGRAPSASTQNENRPERRRTLRRLFFAA